MKYTVNRIEYETDTVFGFSDDGKFLAEIAAEDFCLNGDKSVAFPIEVEIEGIDGSFIVEFDGVPFFDARLKTDAEGGAA